MLLMNASAAAQAIGGKCGGSSPDSDDPQLIDILKMLTPKVEAALNVDSLTLTEHTDRFHLTDMPEFNGARGASDRTITLRLNNGFLSIDEESPVTITAPDGTVLDMDEDDSLDIDVDPLKGTITLNKWIRGVYTVEYTAGFAVPTLPDPIPSEAYDADARVLIGIPDWMRTIVVGYLVNWYRVMYINPRANKDLSYAQVADALMRSLHSAVYNKYQRPRLGCIWGDAR